MAAQIRRSMVAGIAFVVLFVIGFLTSLGNTPNIAKGTSASEAAVRYQQIVASSGHRTGLIVGAYLLIFAAFAFLWFVNGLRSLLASSDPFNGRIMSCLSVLGAAAIASGAMLSAAISMGVSFGNMPVPLDGNVVLQIMDTMIPFELIVFGLTCGVLAALSSVMIIRTGVFATWIGYTGGLAVLGSIFAVIFLPFSVTLLWFVIVAIAGLAKNDLPAADPVT